MGASVTLQPATGYQGRIGRYGPELAAAFLAAAGVREGQRALWGRAGLRDIATGELNAGAGYSSFDDLWEPLVATDGSPGAYYATLKATQREALRQETCRRLGSPAGPFRLTARAWYVRGRV